jgi:hypothetical protein
MWCNNYSVFKEIQRSSGFPAAIILWLWSRTLYIIYLFRIFPILIYRLFLYLGIHRRTAGMGQLFWPIKYINGMQFSSICQWVKKFSMPLYQWVVNLSPAFIPLINVEYYEIYDWVRIFNGNIWMGMVFKSIEYMNGGVLKIFAVRLYPKV